MIDDHNLLFFLLVAPLFLLILLLLLGRILCPHLLNIPLLFSVFLVSLSLYVFVLAALVALRSLFGFFAVLCCEHVCNIDSIFGDLSLLRVVPYERLDAHPFFVAALFVPGAIFVVIIGEVGSFFDLLHCDNLMLLQPQLVLHRQLLVPESILGLFKLQTHTLFERTGLLVGRFVEIGAESG